MHDETILKGSFWYIYFFLMASGQKVKNLRRKLQDLKMKVGAGLQAGHIQFKFFKIFLCLTNIYVFHFVNFWTLRSNLSTKITEIIYEIPSKSKNLELCVTRSEDMQ